MKKENSDDIEFNDREKTDFENTEFDRMDYPKVDQKILVAYAANELTIAQSRLVSELILKSKEWADAYRIILKESATD